MLLARGTAHGQARVPVPAQAAAFVDGAGPIDCSEYYGSDHAEPSPVELSSRWPGTASSLEATAHSALDDRSWAGAAPRLKADLGARPRILHAC